MADNIYQQIQKIRVKLEKLKLKPTGEGEGYNYYQLADFLPQLNQMLVDENLMTRFSMNSETAWVDIISSKEDSVRFQIDKVEAVLPESIAIQNKGATITYLRRYLLIMAFEIVESDPVEVTKELRLTAEELKGFSDADNFEELQKYTSILKKKKGAKYQKLILKAYNDRMEEIQESEVEAPKAKKNSKK